MICPNCGGKKSPRAELCNDCYWPKKMGLSKEDYLKLRICPECGGPKVRIAKICRSCWKKLSRGPNHPHFKGGLLKSGYVVIQKPGHPNADERGRIFEHRYVMSQKLGRSLFSWEIVHHINSVRNDNRPENLKLYPSSEHLSVTKLINEIEKLYIENSILKSILFFKYKGGEK